MVDLSSNVNDFGYISQDGEDDNDDDGPREVDMEGRVEKYIGVKVKACTSIWKHYMHTIYIKHWE